MLQRIYKNGCERTLCDLIKENPDGTSRIQIRTVEGSMKITVPTEYLEEAPFKGRRADHFLPDHHGIGGMI